MYRVDEVEGVAGTKFPGPDSVACVIVFLGTTIICRLYRLIVTDQTQIALHLRVSLYDFVKILVGGPPLLWLEGAGAFIRPPPSPRTGFRRPLTM